LFEQFQTQLFNQFSDMAAHVTTYHQECADITHLLKDQDAKNLAEAQTVFEKGKDLVVCGLDIVNSCKSSMSAHLESLQFEASSLSSQFQVAKSDSTANMNETLVKQQRDLGERLDHIETMIKTHTEKVVCISIMDLIYVYFLSILDGG
jgi:hypothetical protein